MKKEGKVFLFGGIFLSDFGENEFFGVHGEVLGGDEGGGVFGFCGGEAGDVFEAGVPAYFGDGVEGFLGGTIIWSYCEAHFIWFLWVIN